MKRRDALRVALNEMRELGLILAITFFMFFGFSSGEMLQPLNTQFLKIGADTVGILFFFRTSPLLRLGYRGNCIDRYGRKPIVLAASAILHCKLGIVPSRPGFHIANHRLSHCGGLEAGYTLPQPTR